MNKQDIAILFESSPFYNALKDASDAKAQGMPSSQEQQLDSTLRDIKNFVENLQIDDELKDQLTYHIDLFKKATYHLDRF